MLDKHLFNRRFIRLQAVQQLYAFYVCKQANYDGALDQIRTDFIPHFFTGSPTDKAQLEPMIEQAFNLLNASLATTSLHTSVQTPTVPTSSQVQTVVFQVLNCYRKELSRDKHRLEQGLVQAVATIQQDLARILQLLVEWAHIAQKQLNISPACLVNPCELLYGQQDGSWAQLAKQDSASWIDHIDLVKSWYSKFIKKDLVIQRQLTEHTDPFLEKEFLLLLVDRVIFGQEVIQNFFNEVDLNWSMHKHRVRKLVHQSIARSYEQSLKKNLSSEQIESATQWEKAQRFYSSLTDKTLQKEEELEALVTQKSKNWAIERITLLDKTIIKLALCELMCFPDIPTKVSINEYVDIAKIYGSPKSGQFVNGLLDAALSDLHQATADYKTEEDSP